MRRVLLAGVALLCLTSCGLHSEQQARDEATTSVRERALNARQAAMKLLTDPPFAALSTERRLSGLAAAAGGDRYGMVFGQRVTQGGRLEVDVAYDATGNGGGYVAAVVHARLCVRLSGVVGADPQVEMADTPCAASFDRQLNPPDLIVTLED
ncbi:hypothetical protein BSA16_01615 [Micromonospora sp. Rc5]|nr:hypothetical protein BSA16_01615 [Micromonospora sp. Rc5]